MGAKKSHRNEMSGAKRYQSSLNKRVRKDDWVVHVHGYIIVFFPLLLV